MVTKTEPFVDPQMIVFLVIATVAGERFQLVALLGSLTIQITPFLLQGIAHQTA